MDIDYPYIDFSLNIVSHSGIYKPNNPNIKILKSNTPKYTLPSGFTIYVMQNRGASFSYGYAKWFSAYYIERSTSHINQRDYISRKLIMRLYRILEKESGEASWCVDLNGSIPNERTNELGMIKRFMLEYAEKFKT